ncbi:MAG: type II toxin-antitoxin system HicB family antitoxin [Clostridium tyrobutyricum]|jgi:predicted RNase H-like HicB family nuclease|uniref:type II toxin-antitoxin system HicB family antitoxin n=1 Tax=Clostridium tyrobutyricum TaxID=1519 RepID=UPI00242CF39C|nr:type II toxin-antitoxin system HicB family antitoxin [Clostridium tyrobutyricum]MCH4200160.1 type II toxin-antitoxin system HicB family antitoxin [Clostridium tyrobutyricum]MCH4237906.1 type II toxin-antitoxin system HicB family antitoxin [Clostridium tyrobutyricum]MCH4259728.1 type II toxin-antitoxin system HicB family antitoxin [Clostridium tyrobutyricum]
MKKDVYVYPAILTQYKDNIGIVFPDLSGCVSNADNIDEAIRVAKEVLALHLFGMEESKQEIPKPSSIDKIKLDKNDIPLLVDVYMPLYREAIQNNSVKTTVTMPQWLKSLAEENKVNFSQVLQIALREKLNIKN